MVQKLIAIEPFGTVWLVLLRFVPYLTIWGALSFLYVFIPNTRVKISSAALGGMVAAILWETMGWGFAVFVVSSTRYYAVYSSFAILLLFLLWLYIGWVIVLLGAQIAYAHQHLHFYEGENEAWASSPAGRERMVLKMMFMLGRSFHHGLPPPSITDFATRLRLPTDVVKEFTELLQERRLIVPLADEQAFVPARELEQISIKEILDCARSGGGEEEKTSDRLKEDRAVEAVLEEVERSVEIALEGKTLKTLVLAAAPPRA